MPPRPSPPLEPKVVHYHRCHLQIELLVSALRCVSSPLRPSFGSRSLPSISKWTLFASFYPSPSATFRSNTYVMCRRRNQCVWIGIGSSAIRPCHWATATRARGYTPPTCQRPTTACHAAGEPRPFGFAFSRDNYELNPYEYSLIRKYWKKRV
jgi:hypothetical protein